eukprot:g3599.t1
MDSACAWRHIRRRKTQLKRQQRHLYQLQNYRESIRRSVMIMRSNLIKFGRINNHLHKVTKKPPEDWKRIDLSIFANRTPATDAAASQRSSGVSEGRQVYANVQTTSSTIVAVVASSSSSAEGKTIARQLPPRKKTKRTKIKDMKKNDGTKVAGLFRWLNPATGNGKGHSEEVPDPVPKWLMELVDEVKRDGKG